MEPEVRKLQEAIRWMAESTKIHSQLILAVAEKAAQMPNEPDEVKRLQEIITRLTDRIAQQSELLSRNAEKNKRPADFPKVVALIGSSRFKSDFHEVGERLEKQGNLVLMMSFFQHADEVLVSDEERIVLERVDRASLDLCSEAWVINGLITACLACRKNCGLFWDSAQKHYWSLCCHTTLSKLPYVGQSTAKEIAYAREAGKAVTWMNPEEETVFG